MEKRTMSVKQWLKTGKLTRGLYLKYREMKEEKQFQNQFGYTGIFRNRSKNSDKLCIVLAGYKEFSYEAVFGRLKKYAPADLDICIVSSGKYSDILEQMCKENGWSYLSTKENNVSLVQNVAIHLHPNANYIYKLDEDIFITEGYFQNLLRAYEHAKTGDYVPGVIAPLLPINGYAHFRILDKLNLKNIYEEKFETPKYMAGGHRQVENNPEVAKFFWGEGGYVPSIDELNARFSSESLEERACPIRFSIGAILFERKFWQDMGYYHVNRNFTSLGMDEEQVCTFCVSVSRPMMVSENVVAGHLSFGGQNKDMKEYYEQHKERFL